MSKHILAGGFSFLLIQLVIVSVWCIVPVHQWFGNYIDLDEDYSSATNTPHINSNVKSMGSYCPTKYR